MSKNNSLKINATTEIIVLILILLTLLFAKSMPLLVILLLITLIFATLCGSSFKNYLFYAINIVVCFVFVFIASLILRANINLLLYLYKISICTILIENYIYVSTFDRIDSGINKLIYPLKFIKINIDKISFGLASFISFFKYYMEENQKITNNIILHVSPKLYISRVSISMNKVENLQTSLILKFYKVKKERLNTKDILFIIAFVALFIITIIKEVIV